MSNRFPSTNSVKISHIQLINIPSRCGTYLVQISNEEVTKESQKKRADGNRIVWPESLSFTGNFSDQSLWYFRIVKNRPCFMPKKTVGSYKRELLDLLQSQNNGSCKLVVSKDLQLVFTIERQGDALPGLVEDVKKIPISARTSTSEGSTEIVEAHMGANLEPSAGVDGENPRTSTSGGSAEIVETHMEASLEPSAGVDDENAGTPTPESSAEIVAMPTGRQILESSVKTGNLVATGVGILAAHEDSWMSFLPHFETFMSIANKIAEVHPYVQLAWSILSIIPKTIISQSERDDSINKLSQRLKEVYGYIADAKHLHSLRETPRKRETLSVLVQQTIECAYFLQEYAALNKASKILKGVNIDKKISGFIAKFDHILDVMRNSIVLDTNIVTLRISKAISELQEEVQELKELNLLGEMPRAGKAGFISAKACLPGTRQRLITEILHWVSTVSTGGGGGGSERIFLLLGQAGTGKSAVAHTISQIFDKQNRLGSFFCFSRSYEESCNLLFSTISRELADGDVEWRKRLVRIIEKTSIRTSLDILTQFNELIVKPSEAVSTIGPVVIVIDGLDESGDRGKRAVLLDLLFKRCSELPSNYRFVITSRPEPDIEGRCEYPAVFCKRMSDINLAETTNDIQEYISFRLSSVGDLLNKELGGDWQRLLAKRAEGVFQWANLACDFINPTVKFGVTREVKAFISGSTSSLYQTYHEIFLSQPEFAREGYLPAFKTITGALVIMRKPLSIQALQSLLKNNFPHKIKSIMDPFCSLFLGTDDIRTPIQPLHTSLLDFLTTDFIEVIDNAKKRKLSNEFYVNTSDQSFFTLACLKLMNSGIEGGLCFNICNLENSHVRNRDVPDLEDRIQKKIPSHLSYASYFWAIHLRRSNVSEDLLIQLRILIRTNILFLFEALSLLEKSVEQVCISMKILADWCKGVDNELSTQAEDAYKFGHDFGDVMVESTSHLYLSALPFAPNGSFIRDQYLDSFPHHFDIELGQSLGSLLSSNIMKQHPRSLSPTALAFSPQGRYIATGFENGDFWFWDYKTGAMVRQWGTDDQAEICTIVFSTNGELVNSCFLNGSFNTWDIQKHESVHHSYGVFKNTCKYSTISSDGRYLVFHSYLDEISLYDIASGSSVQLGLLGIKSMFSPNGELLASTILTPNRDCKTISLWSIQKQKLIGSLCPESTIHAMAFSPGGNHIALGCSDTIQLWDVLTKTKFREFGFDSGHSLMFFSNDHNLLFSTHLGIQIIDVSTGKLIQSFPKARYASSLAVSPDCKHIAWATMENIIQVQGCESMSRKADSIDDGLQYTKATFSPLNTYLILEGFDHDSSRKYLQILNTTTIMEVTAQIQLENFIIGTSANDKYIAYASTRGLCLWSDKGGERILDISERKLTTLAFSFTGDRLISGDRNGTVKVWNTHTPQLVCPPYKAMPPEARITALAFSSTGEQLLVVYLSGLDHHMIEIHDSQFRKRLRGPFTHHSREISSSTCFVAFSANETHIVYCLPLSWTIIDVGTGQIRKFEGFDYLHPEISLNRRYVVWKDEGKAAVRNIDTRVGEVVYGKWLDFSSANATFSNNSERIVTMDTRGEINFWDILTGNKSTTPTFYHPRDVASETSIFASNEKYLVSVHNHIVKIWSLETHQHVSQHQSNSRVRPSASSVDHSEIKTFDSANYDGISSMLDDQERIEYAQVAWKKALFSESSETDQNGWVLGPNGELLFWVPTERRKGLWRPKIVHLMGAPITKLNFDNFVHGTRWIECKETL